MTYMLCRYREQNTLHRGGNWSGLVTSDKHPVAVPEGLDSKLCDVGILARTGAGPGHPPAVPSHSCSAFGLVVLTVLLIGLLESSLEENEDNVLE